MVRSAILAFLMAAGLAGTSQGQSIFPGGPRFDGSIKIVDLAGVSCPPGQEGKIFRAAWRIKPSPNSRREEAFTIAIPTPAGGLYVAALGDGTLAGADQAAVGTLVLDAFRQGVENLIFNLRFTPGVITGDTPQFTFRGSVRNYLFPGCTAIVRGSFFRREP